jgi:hypothetical protein
MHRKPFLLEPWLTLAGLASLTVGFDRYGYLDILKGRKERDQTGGQQSHMHIWTPSLK